MNINDDHPQRLRKAMSDASFQIIDKYQKLEWQAATETTTTTTANQSNVDDTIIDIEEVQRVVCECCGLAEDCTQQYIRQVKGGYSGKWVCGLCSEAVKEKLARSKAKDVQEAITLLREVCQRYNNTTRLNPKLSLTCAMRDIAKRSWENRTTTNNDNSMMIIPISKITRTTSCFPKI